MERATFLGPARWALIALACLCAGAVVAAVLLIGPKSSSAAASSRTVTAERGVVQSTVTGSGTLEARQTNVNFASSGQLTGVLVHAGQKVVEGQALARIDSTDAHIALEQAQANLSSAKAKLDQAEAADTPTTSATSAQTNNQPSSGSGNSGSSNSGTSNSTESAATKAANIASAQADVDSAQASVDSAERTVAKTTLTAPAAGTVAQVNGSVGDTVSGGGSSSASDSSSSGSDSSDSGSGAGASGSSASSGSGSGSSGSGSSSSGSSSAFIVLVGTGKLELQVPFSESDIGKIKRHQPATVTITALPGTELAAHVTSIDTLPTTNSGVTSYAVTFALDQKSSKLRPGMSASAQVVVKRVKDALNLPSAAISRRGVQSTVTLLKNGKSETQPVVTGIVGDSTTQIVSGLEAGDQVAMSVGGASSLSSGISGALGGKGGSGTLGGGGLGGGGPQVIAPGGGGGGFGGAGGGRRLGGG